MPLDEVAIIGSARFGGCQIDITNPRLDWRGCKGLLLAWISAFAGCFHLSFPHGLVLSTNSSNSQEAGRTA